MFAVSQCGTLCERVEKIERCYLDNEEYQKELSRISQTTYKKFSYLPIGVDQKKIDAEINEHMKNSCIKSEFCQIKINGKLFGEYDREIGDYIFECVLNGIEKDENLIDLRRLEEQE